MPRQFGHTWWGREWISALEGRAALDPNRLGRGRTYARQDRVARLELSIGKVTALVRGNRALPYRVTVEVATFDDAQWVRVAAAIAARAANAAALLDGEMDPGLAADTTAAGLDLFPGPGDLSVRCSCPDWADPCKHAAAVCYVVADALDEDPFVLFTLRGRACEALMDQVRAQRAALRPGVDGPAADATAPAPGSGPGGSGAMVSATFGGGAVVDPGMTAREAWGRTLAPRPDRRDLPKEPGTPAAWPADPPREAPFSAAGLTDLAADAARRALAQLADGAPSYLDLEEQADLARRAADQLGHLESLLVLAKRANVASAALTHQAVAWRNAGKAGLTAIDESLWRPPSQVIDRGLAAFEDAGIDTDEVSVRSNRLTSGDVQLRVTSDGQWWRYEKRGRAWELVEPPASHPDDLISG